MSFKSIEETHEDISDFNCESELGILPNKNVSAAKDHGKNYIKVRSPLIAIFV